MTPREQDVALQVMLGKTNKGIAAALGISLSTVKTHLREIFRKHSVTNRTELAVKLMREKT